VLSYDGHCGGKTYGEPLPNDLAHRILLDVGRSSQATLNGRDEATVESLYVSRSIPLNGTNRNLSLADFTIQRPLFA
jgi:hypothetical protein